MLLPLFWYNNRMRRDSHPRLQGPGCLLSATMTSMMYPSAFHHHRDHRDHQHRDHRDHRDHQHHGPHHQARSCPPGQDGAAGVGPRREEKKGKGRLLMSSDVLAHTHTDMSVLATAGSAVTFRFGVGGRFAVLTLHGTPSTSESREASPRSPSSSSTTSQAGGSEGGDAAGGQSLLERWEEEDCGRRLADADMRRLLIQEDVPHYLELPLLSALNALHLEEVAQCTSHWASSVFDQRRAREGADDWASAIKKRNAAYQDTMELTEKEKTKLILIEAYGAVVSTQKGCEAIARMNEIHAVMLEEIISKTEATISELHQKQSEEMNKAAGDGGEISSLVAKHVKQMELTERKWGEKLKEVLKKQKRAYGRSILRWATEGLPKNVTNDVIQEFKMAKKKERRSRTSSPIVRRHTEGLQGSPAAGRDETKRKTSWWSKKKSETGDQPDSPQLKSSGSSIQTQPQPQYQVPTLSTVSTAEYKWEHFTALLGRNKALHHFGLGSGDTSQFCRLRPTSDSSSVRAHTIRDLYSHSLSAIVLVVDRGLTYTNKVNKEFLRCCGASPEPHFDSFQKQVQQIKEEVGRSMQPGDVFVTRHSNLEAAHVVFHLVGDNEPINSFTVDSPLVQGLRTILALAHDFDVATLSLPILLKELQSEVEAANRPEDCARAAEVVVKSVKTFLNDKAAAEDPSIKTIQFLCGRNLFPTYLNTLNNVYARFGK